MAKSKTTKILKYISTQELIPDLAKRLGKSKSELTEDEKTNKRKSCSAWVRFEIPESELVEHLSCTSSITVRFQNYVRRKNKYSEVTGTQSDPFVAPSDWYSPTYEKPKLTQLDKEIKVAKAMSGEALAHGLAEKLGISVEEASKMLESNNK